MSGTPLDLVAAHSREYAATPSPALVETKPGHYLAIEGQGAPGPRGGAFQQAIGALYAATWTIRMSLPKARRWKIPPLEALWWGAEGVGGAKAFLSLPRRLWHWKILLRIPDEIGGDDLIDAKRRLAGRGKEVPAIDRVKVETIAEGECVQLLHVGPWSRERTSIAKLDAFAEAEGLTEVGRHHEIYWNDPRRTAPSRLKTTLRQPVRP